MAKPLTDAEVEPSLEWVVHTPDGRSMRDVDVSVTEEQYGQMWNGYMCAWCYQPWHDAWPKECTLTGCWSPKPMSESVQRRYMDERFGYRWFGISKETYERMADEKERAGWKPSGDSRIWVPGSVN